MIEFIDIPKYLAISPIIGETSLGTCRGPDYFGKDLVKITFHGAVIQLPVLVGVPAKKSLTDGQFKGVLNECNLRTGRENFYRNYVKTAILLQRWLLCQIVHRNKRECFLFFRSHGQFRIAELLRFPALNLYKDDGIFVLSHNIDLAHGTAIITFQDPIAKFLQMADGNFFSRLARSYPGEILHLTLPIKEWRSAQLYNN